MQRIERVRQIWRRMGYKDTHMRRRITYLVHSIRDPFAADVLYHKSCWTEHVLHNLNNQLKKDSHLQNTKIDDARKLLFCHVDEVILEKLEIEKLDNFSGCLEITNLLLVIMV